MLTCDVRRLAAVIITFVVAKLSLKSVISNLSVIDLISLIDLSTVLAKDTKSLTYSL